MTIEKNRDRIKNGYEDIEMTGRLKNALRRNGIENLEDLKNFPKEYAKYFRNIGEQTWEELMAICNAKGIELLSIEELCDQDNHVKFSVFEGVILYKKGIYKKSDFRLYSEKDLKDMFDENKSLLKKIIKLRRSYGFIENASKEIGYTTQV